MPLYPLTLDAEPTRAAAGRSVAAGDELLGRVVKRCVDVVGAGVGSICLSPLMLIIYALVRLTSRGPAMFFQARRGREGREFYVMKFRTMVTDAECRLGELEALNESAGGVLFKIKCDPRVTRVGKFLRKTSLDELPQLFNVLKGEMSLVGPRPLQLRDCALLEAMDPEGYARRLEILPGVTGPWQVGGRSEVDCRGMLRLDLDYVENRSLVTDLKILFQTVKVVFFCRGAC